MVIVDEISLNFPGEPNSYDASKALLRQSSFACVMKGTLWAKNISISLGDGYKLPASDVPMTP